MDLAERIAFILEQRPELNMSQWSLQAGLSRGYVQLARSGLRGERMGPEQAKKLARVARCSWQWLLSGDGEWSDDAEAATPSVGAPDRWIELFERYPSLSDVLAAARARRLDSALVEGLRQRAQVFKGEDPGAPYWRKLLVDIVQTDKLLAAEIEREPTENERGTFGKDDEK